MRLLALCLVFFATCLNAGDLPHAVKVMSFNIRFGTAKDGANAWEKRRYLVAETLQLSAPDIFGLQESIDFQTEWLAEQLPEYQYVGTSREVEPGAGEGVPVFFRKSRFELIEAGDFWLSETPEERGSMGWDAACPRIVTWARLKDRQRDGSELLFVSTHFDHKGKLAKENSAKLLRSRLDEWMAEHQRVIVVGDFNCTPDSQPYQTLLGVSGDSPLVDSFRSANPKVTTELSTLTRWSGEYLGRRIDWVLNGSGFSAMSSVIDRTQDAGRYPSDHYPVTAVLRYAE